MHIWTIEKWKKVFDEHLCRSGLYLRCEKEVEEEVRIACKEFAKWLRSEYYFPVKVVVYIKSCVYLNTQDKDIAVGTFFEPYDYTQEPFIRIATGDYKELKESIGRDNALASILKCMAHELTHYFQWINSLKLTEMGRERQASQYSRFIMDEYSETREHP